MVSTAYPVPMGRRAVLGCAGGIGWCGLGPRLAVVKRPAATPRGSSMSHSGSVCSSTLSHSLRPGSRSRPQQDSAHTVGVRDRPAGVVVDQVVDLHVDLAAQFADPGGGFRQATLPAEVVDHHRPDRVGYLGRWGTLQHLASGLPEHAQRGRRDRHRRDDHHTGIDEGHDAGGGRAVQDERCQEADEHPHRQQHTCQPGGGFGSRPVRRTGRAAAPARARTRSSAGDRVAQGRAERRLAAAGEEDFDGIEHRVAERAPAAPAPAPPPPRGPAPRGRTDSAPWARAPPAPPLVTTTPRAAPRSGRTRRPGDRPGRPPTSPQLNRHGSEQARGNQVDRRSSRCSVRASPARRGSSAARLIGSLCRPRWFGEPFAADQREASDCGQRRVARPSSGARRGATPSAHPGDHAGADQPADPDQCASRQLVGPFGVASGQPLDPIGERSGAASRSATIGSSVSSGATPDWPRSRPGLACRKPCGASAVVGPPGLRPRRAAATAVASWSALKSANWACTSAPLGSRRRSETSSETNQGDRAAPQDDPAEPDGRGCQIVEVRQPLRVPALMVRAAVLGSVAQPDIDVLRRCQLLPLGNPHLGAGGAHPASRSCHDSSAMCSQLANSTAMPPGRRCSAACCTTVRLRSSARRRSR